MRYTIIVLCAALALIGCEQPKTDGQKAADQNAKDFKKLVNNRLRMAAAVPVPDLKTSAERQAVVRVAKSEPKVLVARRRADHGQHVRRARA